MELNEKISVICAVKNRINMLKFSINSWVAYKNIHEFIIVDWSSDDITHDEEEYFKKLDDRIKIIKVENEKYFNLSKSFNLAAKNASGDLLLKLDVDYILNPYYDFFETYNINKNEFLTGDWNGYEKNREVGFLLYLNGFLYVHKENFFKVEGYNENLRGYGYDDCDLYSRLESVAGLKRTYLDCDKIVIYHNPHEDNLRSKNYECKNIKLTHSRNYNFYSNKKL